MEKQLTAAELFKSAQKNKKQILKKRAEVLENKFSMEITDMMRSGEYHTEIHLTNSDMTVLDRVTEKLRELGYKFCLHQHTLVDKNNERTENFYMRVSIAHIANEEEK